MDLQQIIFLTTIVFQHKIVNNIAQTIVITLNFLLGVGEIANAQNRKQIQKQHQKVVKQQQKICKQQKLAQQKQKLQNKQYRIYRNGGYYKTDSRETKLLRQPSKYHY